MKRVNRESRIVHQVSVIGMVLLGSAGFSPVGAQYAPGAPSGITMSLYPVEKGADGQQYIVTKVGYKVTVPGLGISPNANDIAVYRDNQNHFWYVDKNGATQPVSQSQLQWTEAQIKNQQAMHGQTAQNVIINNQQPVKQGMSPAGTAAVTGMAAAGGAMMGSMITNSANHNSYGMPYGTPMYNEGGHYYYNGADGKHYEVPYNSANPYTNEWNHQEQYQNNSQDRQNAYNNLNKNQQQMLKNQGYEDEKGQKLRPSNF